MYFVSNIPLNTLKILPFQPYSCNKALPCLQDLGVIHYGAFFLLIGSFKGKDGFIKMHFYRNLLLGNVITVFLGGK